MKILAIVFALLLAGCASQWETLPQDDTKGVAQQWAEHFAMVDDKNRDVRVCLLGSAVVEVMTAQVMRNGRPADLALTRLMVLEGAIGKAKTVSPDWLNSDMADIGLTFSKVLKESGQSRIAEIMLGGFSVSNISNVLKGVTVFSVKGRAALTDIRVMLGKVESDEMDKAKAWSACETRMASNRRILESLNGINPEHPSAP